MAIEARLDLFDSGLLRWRGRRYSWILGRIVTQSAARKDVTASVDALQRDLFNLYREAGQEVAPPWRSCVSARQYRYLFQSLLPLVTRGTKVLDWGAGKGNSPGG